MQLYYWYCHYGPGHHSNSDGYEEFDDSYTEDEIISEINERFYDYDWPITYVQKVNAIPKHILETKIRDQEDNIRYAQARIKQLQKLPIVDNFGLQPVQSEIDYEIIEALKNKPIYKVVLQLAKDGLYFSYDDVDNWRYYRDWITPYYPSADIRDAVLESIKKVEHYKG